MGLNFGAGSAVPQYQDISFKTDFNTRKAGKFSIFGIGGLSYAETLDEDRDSTEDNIYDNNMRITGRYIITKNSENIPLDIHEYSIGPLKK